VNWRRYVEIEDDILDLIRSLPDEINDTSTTTEFKFLTVGSVLWQCHHEIKYLRDEIARLKSDGRSKKGKKVY
jgi:uncharacterized small protein (DUF1192 family)